MRLDIFCPHCFLPRYMLIYTPAPIYVNNWKVMSTLFLTLSKPPCKHLHMNDKENMWAFWLTLVDKKKKTTFRPEVCPHILKSLFLFSCGEKKKNLHQKSLGSLFGFPLVSTQHAATVLDKWAELCGSLQIWQRISHGFKLKKKRRRKI